MEHDAKFLREPTACAARFAADLELFAPRQGTEKFDRMPLEIEVSLGEEEFSDEEGFGFRLRFRKVIVEVYLEKAEISKYDRYQRTIPKEEFSELLERIAESAQSIGGEAEVSVAPNIGNLLRFLGLGLSVNGRISGDTASKKVNKTVLHNTVRVVQWAGAGRWQVGHEKLGDPLTVDGLLSGAYFYQSADDRNAEDLNPLCYVEPATNANYSGFVELRARKKDCRYFPSDSSDSSEIEYSKNKTAIERVTTLRMLEEANRRDGMNPPDGEIILARSHFAVKKKRRVSQVE